MYMAEIQPDALRFSIEAVKNAGEIARRMCGKVSIEYKDSGVPYDVITEADREINAYIIDAIKDTFPSHDIYSEEGGEEEHQASRYQWTVDAIDGSSNFARGIPHFAICLGLLEDGVPMCGAVYNPMTEDVFSFEKTAATLNGLGVSVSNATKLAASNIFLTIGSRKENWPWGLTMYKTLLEEGARVRNFGASALDICFVAAGRVDAVIYGGVTLADIAPAVGTLRAAGGEVYDFDTGEIAALLLTPQKVIACGNATLRDSLRALRD